MALITSINPHDPDDVVLELEAVELETVAAIVDRAVRGFQAWSECAATQRKDALDAIADDIRARTEELAQLVRREVGKPISEARGEVKRAVELTRYYAQMVLLPSGDDLPPADGISWLVSRRRPRGVVAVVTPWNFPVAIPLWKSIPALAFGNAVMLKPASPAIACARAIEEIVARHVPAGAFTVAPGGGQLAAALIEAPEVAAVTFTGSTSVGRGVAAQAGRRGIPAQCEMGGQNPSVVLADADQERAARVIAYAAMGYAGQKCTATSRVIVERSILDEFRERLLDAVAAVVVGDPADETTLVGPLISATAREEALAAAAKSSGRTLIGGSSVEDAAGYYLQPTVVEAADENDILARDEVFAPVVALLNAVDAEDALRMANGVRYGLSAAVFTCDLRQAISFADRLEAGLVRVNASTAGVDYYAPFGGVKESSVGPREQGLAARDFFTETRTVLVTP